MNTSGLGNSSVSVPELVLRLCTHLSKNDQTLSSRLYQLAVNFLQYQGYTNDAEFDLSEIKMHLSSHKDPEAALEQFEILYSEINNSSILHNKNAIMSFLLNVAKMDIQKDSFKLKLVQNVEKIAGSQSLPNSKSQTSVTSAPSLESIRNIYQGNLIDRPFSRSSRNESTSNSNILSSIWSRQEFGSALSKTTNLTLASETDLLQDIIYSLQGIEGRFIKREPGGVGFLIDLKIGRNFSPIQKSIASRLLGLSFLHNKLKQYCEENDKQKGAMSQALISILRDEISSYYKTIALLQANMKKQGCEKHAELSLRRALYIVQEHISKFEWLAYITEECSDKKGGALVTSIHGYLQHGSICVQEVSEKVLTSVCKPLYIMLSRWLLDGEINDPCNEFFIEARSINASERLWHDKYHVKKSMIPSFISMDQAKKILATGKSINFLRQICKDNGQLSGRESLQKFFKSTTADALFAPEQSLEFHTTLENVYRETSLRVLDLLKNKFRLMEHLHSLRRYLLLGQGDFIRHLLELLAPELNKPAQEIYGHTLTTILESAIRVTNAQFEDEDTLQRLNVSFMGHSQGDTGWDVFSLVYRVDGPVSTIFQPTMSTYQCLFGALWKAKRMEFVLANMKKQQITISKMFKYNLELLPVMHTFHVLTSEMIHFLHQTQYYFLFEVLECSWAEMLCNVNQAECLDDIIQAHTQFLSSVQTGVLLDEESKHLFSQLRSIYNFVLNLETHQETLYLAASKEHEALMDYNKKQERSDQFGLTLDDELKAKERIASFRHFLNSMKATVKCLAQTYKSFVKNYLKSLSSSPNMNLQLLSVRLSFNDYYSVI
ncbi:gamma-tubulin complex component 3 homolog [Coccinella septempunctata]|uniref:gamma-tubulin complex component 3 homolog n=1 Tax=Coccinella septempunctata TaxID=41139 RepID=UPI001D073CEA|nr:gamma-tubulin complex component 3 homolog [Coccinella septempunctata]